MTDPQPAGSRWFDLKPWHTNLALLLIGFGMIGFTQQLIREGDRYRIGFSGVSAMHLTLYLGALLVFLVKPANVDRRTFPLILTVAILCRLVALFPDPFLSSDVYRYVWDGIVQHHHINPFRYVPGDPALAALRQPYQDIYSEINRREYAHTIYPPIAQMIFYVITWISPTVTFMKFAMVLFEGLTLYGLVLMLRELGLRRECTLLYAWFPMLIWEFSGSGHVDAIILAFLTFAILFRYRRQPVLTGLFLGMAVLTKFYPLVLFPAFYQRGDWKMPATVAGLAAATYAIYLSAGTMVFGFLGGYAQEEGMETGARYFLYEWAQKLPGLHGLSNPSLHGLRCLGLARADAVGMAQRDSAGQPADGVPSASVRAGHGPDAALLAALPVVRGMAAAAAGADAEPDRAHLRGRIVLSLHHGAGSGIRAEAVPVE